MAIKKLQPLKLPLESVKVTFDIQWRDHFHIRDQTRKTVTNSLLLFLGFVGFEFMGVENLVMVPAYLVVIMLAIFGWVVAIHHRLRQSQKFDIITGYENALGIYESKRKILEEGDVRAGIASKVFTAGFIRAIHASFGVFSFLLLLHRLLGSV